MSITRLLVRFTAIYLGVLAVTLLVVVLLGMKKPSGFNAFLLMMSTMWVCTKFAEKNGSPLQGSERVKAVLGMFALDMGVQFVGAYSAVPDAGLGPLAFALITVGALHLLAIYLGTWAAAKRFAKLAQKATITTIIRRA
jgi:hypothetical protein